MLEKSYFFPSDIICAEDPDWDRVGISPPSLAARCIQVLARFFSLKPEYGCGLTGGDRANFLSMNCFDPVFLVSIRECSLIT